MAKDIKWIEVCDPCNQHDLPNTEAVAQHTIAVDGRPPVEVDVCGRDEVFFQEFVRLFVDCGREIPAPAQEEAPPRKRAKAVKTAKPKELGAPPPQAAEQLPIEDKAEEGKSDKPVRRILCPLPHPTEGGGPKLVNYSDRNSHADMIHDGLRAWDIAWEDPEGILPRESNGEPRYQCRAHAQCIKLGLAFTTPQSLPQHYRGCPLPRIDQEPEGAPKKSDERAASSQ
jgi:hypothetical protein